MKIQITIPHSFSTLTLILRFASAAHGRQQTPPNVTPSVERLRVDIDVSRLRQISRTTEPEQPAQISPREYIAREFDRIGLRRGSGYDTAGMSKLEADSPNRYLQKFPYVAGVELGKGNELVFSFAPNTASTTSLRLGEDWTPLGFSTNVKIGKT